MKKYKDKLIAIITKHFPHAKIHLFGSQATGAARAGSDIDLAIDNIQVADRGIMALVNLEIEDSTIPYKVDFVDFHSIPKKMQQDILKEGIIWKN